MTDALKAEQQARKDDNAALTKDILKLEAENEKLKPKWASIATAPHDRRILIKSQSGEVYVGHWVQEPFTGDEAYCLGEAPDGTQSLVYPIEWREI